jgi:hypothetical protein
MRYVYVMDAQTCVCVVYSSVRSWCSCILIKKEHLKQFGKKVPKSQFKELVEKTYL